MRTTTTGELTFGGYSNNIVVDERYVHSISPKLNLAAVAPLLCAGITTYSPLEYWKVGKGRRWGGWLGWAGAHGVEVCSLHGRGGGAVYDVGGKDRGRAEAGRR